MTIVNKGTRTTKGTVPEMYQVVRYRTVYSQISPNVLSETCLVARALLTQRADVNAVRTVSR